MSNADTSKKVNLTYINPAALRAVRNVFGVSSSGRPQ